MYHVFSFPKDLDLVRHTPTVRVFPTEGRAALYARQASVQNPAMTYSVIEGGSMSRVTFPVADGGRPVAVYWDGDDVLPHTA